jgi:hypothetical protein
MMIELASLKSLVDLFKELLAIREDRRQDKRKVFDRVCKPLYEQLEPIAKEYYAIVSECASKLEDSKPDYFAIAKRVSERRAAIVIGRNGILGACDSQSERSTNFYKKPRFRLRPLAPNSTFDELLDEFIYSIYRYFYEEKEHILGQEEDTFEYRKKLETSSRTTDLIMTLKSAAVECVDVRYAPKLLISVRYFTNSALEELEDYWTRVSRRYTELKTFCDA